VVHDDLSHASTAKVAGIVLKGAFALLFVVACSPASSEASAVNSPPTPALSSTGSTSHPVPSSPSTPLSVWNDTDRIVRVLVNGVAVTVMNAKTEQDPIVAPLPELPWQIVVEAMDGTPLATATVAQSPSSYRFDLSCGRIDIWSRVPVLGPPNGPGSPGDCGASTASSSP